MTLYCRPKIGTKWSAEAKVKKIKGVIKHHEESYQYYSGRLREFDSCYGDMPEDLRRQIVSCAKSIRFHLRGWGERKRSFHQAKRHISYLYEVLPELKHLHQRSGRKELVESIVSYNYFVERASESHRLWSRAIVKEKGMRATIRRKKVKGKFIDACYQAAP